MGMFSTVKHDLKEVGLVTLYFIFCFGVILTLKTLLLDGYHIEFYAFSTALVGVLIVTKVVVLLGKTRAGTNQVRCSSFAWRNRSVSDHGV